MGYKIGEIADILGVSTEMIRYYEKMGVITPNRNSSNYRTYSIWDIFTLLEASQLKNFDININKINEMMNHNFSKTLKNYLEKYKRNLINDRKKKNAVLERIDELMDRSVSATLNNGNFWIKQIPSFYRYYFCDSYGDEYSDIRNSANVLKMLNSDDIFQFVDSQIVFGNRNKWYFSIDEKYCEVINIDYENGEYLKGDTCLCTISDMGDIGDFSESCIEGIQNYSASKGYVQSGDIYAVLCGRGIDDKQYHRYLELRMPVIVD